MKTQKMIKTARALDKALKIVRWVLIACTAAATLIFGIFTVISANNNDVGTGSYTVDIGPLTFELAEETTLDSGAALIYIWIMIAAAIVSVAVICCAIDILRKILEPMTEGKPFAPFVSKEIRKLAFTVLIFGIISNVMSVVETLGAINIFDLNDLLQNSRIRSAAVNFRCDVTFIIVFFILTLISYVFQYGEELQKLSDETL